MAVEAKDRLPMRQRKISGVMYLQLNQLGSLAAAVLLLSS
jgi:hypothetical protein